MRYQLAIGIGVVIILSMANVWSASAQALQMELQELVKSNPEILAREETAAAAREATDKAYAGYLPRLDVLGAYGPQYIDSPLTAQNGGSAWISQAQILSGRVTQNLFDGFATPGKCAFRAP